MAVGDIVKVGVGEGDRDVGVTKGEAVGRGMAVERTVAVTGEPDAVLAVGEGPLTVRGTAVAPAHPTSVSPMENHMARSLCAFMQGFP